jgi:hypothetical protein
MPTLAELAQAQAVLTAYNAQNGTNLRLADAGDIAQQADDAITDGLAARFDRATLGKLLDDARDLEHRGSKAWGHLADLLWAAYSIRKD